MIHLQTDVIGHIESPKTVQECFLRNVCFYLPCLSETFLEPVLEFNKINIKLLKNIFLLFLFHAIGYCNHKQPFVPTL